MCSILINSSCWGSMDNRYNPFDKQIDEITFDDLNLLIVNGVAEGYYVEYKSDFQEPKKIAKSIASFANTYGGWYFIGIEDEDGTNIAKNIVGFDISKHDKPPETIRHIVREYIHPIPYFKMRVLSDDSGKQVLVAFVPESFEAPHVLRDGAVYIRNGEESIPIKDKHALDKLYQKGMLLNEKVNAFLENPFGLTIGESKNSEPTINIYFLPKDFMMEYVDNFFESSFLDELMKLITQEESFYEGEGNLSYSMPFQNVTRTSHSIIFRDTTQKIGFYNFILEFFYNGVARIQIPVSYNTITSSDLEDEYIKCLSEQLGPDLPFYRLVDLFKILLSLRFAIKKYSRFMSFMKSSRGIITIWEMKNIFRLIPFVQAESFLEHVGKYGIPISMYEHKRIPDEFNQNKWVEVEDLDSIHFEINTYILMMLGLPIDTKMFKDSMHLFFKDRNRNRK